jgi:hypothetical protein
MKNLQYLLYLAGLELMISLSQRGLPRETLAAWQQPDSRFCQAEFVSSPQHIKHETLSEVQLGMFKSCRDGKHSWDGTWRERG